MADQDWDSVTRIGSKVRAGGGAATDREKVVKGRSAVNAAQRSGAIVGTEKKWGTSNTVSTTRRCQPPIDTNEIFRDHKVKDNA